MEKNKGFVCDPESGFCSIPSSGTTDVNYNALNTPKEKPLHIVYFSDPICSYCWNLDGYLRKLELEYGDYFTLEERMGGLMPEFGVESYEGEVTDPSKMAHMWNKVSEDLRVPVNGNVWLKNPLKSSFPASIAFKAAEMQSKEKGMKLLRRLREALFVEAKDISNWAVIETEAKAVGLDLEKFKTAFNDGSAKAEFDKDLKLTREAGVDLFPTLFVINKRDMHSELSAPTMYIQLEEAIKKLNEGAKLKTYDKENVLALVEKFGSTNLKEMSILTGKTFPVCEDLLDKLVQEDKLVEIKSAKGSLWRIK